MYIEYLFEVIGKVFVEFFEGILEKCFFDILKMKFCVFDGVNVMFGVYNGMVVYIRKKVFDFVSIYCVCYRLVLACVDTCKELMYLLIVERLLN